MVNPDFVTIVKVILDARRVNKREELDAAVEEMIASKKPYFLRFVLKRVMFFW